MIDFPHRKNGGGDITIATIPVNSKDATGFGILKANDENQITSFVENHLQTFYQIGLQVSDDMKQQGRDYLVSMGIYVFNKKSFEKNV